MSNFLGIQIYDALEGVTAGRLSDRCSELLGLNPNRRLADQQENLPFALDVVFGTDSFPIQVSQVLAQEDEIKETQLIMMAKEEEILIDVESIKERATDMYNNQQVMMKALSDIQNELDITRKDSKTKKSKKAKAEKKDSDIFNRGLLHDDESVIEAMAKSVDQIKTDVKELMGNKVAESEEIKLMRSKVEEIEGKVDKMEKSMEDIKSMLSKLLTTGGVVAG